MVWDELELNPKIIEAVKKAKLSSYGSVLLASVGELTSQTKLSVKDVINLRKAVSKVVIKQPPVSALQLYQKLPKSWPSESRKLTTGCKILDGTLRGGLLIQRLTEIAGESASGKTQFCLQLALTAQLPEKLGGFNSSVAYICTEDAFPMRRLQQMIVTFKKQNDTNVPNNLGDHVFIEHVADFDTMKICVLQHLPALINSRKIGLVIIDSVAAIFRGDYTQQQSFRRSQDVQWLGKELCRLCSDFGVTVVCVNQVTDVIEQNCTITRHRSIPSLGLTWANLVTTRLMLSRTSRTVHKPPDHQCQEGINHVTLPNPVIRTLEIVFAPNLPQTQCSFIVNEYGIKGLGAGS